MDNHVILQSIVGNLSTKELLPLRLVSKKLKEIADKQLSNCLKSTFARNTKRIAKELKYFKSLKIARVQLHFPKNPIQRYNREIFEKIVAKIGDNGHQIRELNLKEFPFHNDEDFAMLDKILCSTPNLKKLRLDLSEFVAGKFPDQSFYPSVEDINLESCEIHGHQDIVPMFLKKFPNRKTNFGQAEMDLELVRLVATNKVGGKFDTFRFNSQQTWEQVIQEMAMLPTGKLQIKNLSVDLINTFPNRRLKYLSEIITKSENSLQVLEVRCLKLSIAGFANTEFKIPPLLNLKKLKLELPIIRVNSGFAELTYNLGDYLGKDFPKLEYLVLQRTDPRTGPYCASDIDALWKLWEPFLPLATLKHNEVEVQPFKYLKFADLAIPENWVGAENQIGWGRNVVQTYLKLYGNAGRGSMGKFIEWVQLSA